MANTKGTSPKAGDRIFSNIQIEGAVKSKFESEDSKEVHLSQKRTSYYEGSLNAFGDSMGSNTLRSRVSTFHCLFSVPKDATKKDIVDFLKDRNIVQVISYDLKDVTTSRQREFYAEQGDQYGLISKYLAVDQHGNLLKDTEGNPFFTRRFVSESNEDLEKRDESQLDDLEKVIKYWLENKPVIKKTVITEESFSDEVEASEEKTAKPKQRLW